ncbi:MULTISPECIES: hypothetical protein [Moorena]|uniref:Uncharacterized protein n=1 Tax=Moorena producens (strain JHB) TaxID=1454205 RepID=A0A9Q9SU53_MOOP1|nr:MULTISPECIES: hypothetical protein [Moorena]NEP69185.1 hypothetical protein [Moorena sp. SIO3A5]NEQ05794.1 hypothetical protein [Moorena sp. SIO4E2]NER89671.1 hypothetical protein [Moorena sp. SIO3A2]NES42323.1 hypothetical protein [Moorena sp. SIO2C4]NET65050.1 hypothetical protein [Moorena sp. SIO1G6]
MGKSVGSMGSMGSVGRCGNGTHFYSFSDTYEVHLIFLPPLPTPDSRLPIPLLPNLRIAIK